MVAKIGGQRGKVLAAIEAKNQKLRQQYEIKLTREVFNKFDEVRWHNTLFRAANPLLFACTIAETDACLHLSGQQ